MTVEEHEKNYRRALELTGNKEAAVAIMQEAGKDQRQSRIRDTPDTRNNPATEKQLSYLKLLGGTATEGMTKSEASAKIEEIKGGK